MTVGDRSCSGNIRNHINPAVTVGLARPPVPVVARPAYIAAQPVATAAPRSHHRGAALPRVTPAGIATYTGDISAVQAFFAEFVGTFIPRVHTVFGVIHRKASCPPGVAIGPGVRGDHPVAPVTGASDQSCPAPSGRCSSSRSPAARRLAPVAGLPRREFSQAHFAALPYVAISTAFRADTTKLPSVPAAPTAV